MGSHNSPSSEHHVPVPPQGPKGPGNPGTPPGLDPPDGYSGQETDIRLPREDERISREEVLQFLAQHETLDMHLRTLLQQPGISPELVAELQAVLFWKSDLSTPDMGHLSISEFILTHQESKETISNVFAQLESAEIIELISYSYGEAEQALLKRFWVDTLIKMPTDTVFSTLMNLQLRNQGSEPWLKDLIIELSEGIQQELNEAREAKNPLQNRSSGAMQEPEVLAIEESEAPKKEGGPGQPEVDAIIRTKEENESEQNTFSRLINTIVRAPAVQHVMQMDWFRDSFTMVHQAIDKQLDRWEQFGESLMTEWKELLYPSGMQASSLSFTGTADNNQSRMKIEAFSEVLAECDPETIAWLSQYTREIHANDSHLAEQLIQVLIHHGSQGLPRPTQALALLANIKGELSIPLLMNYAGSLEQAGFPLQLLMDGTLIPGITPENQQNGRKGLDGIPIKDKQTDNITHLVADDKTFRGMQKLLEAFSPKAFESAMHTLVQSEGMMEQVEIRNRMAILLSQRGDEAIPMLQNFSNHHSPEVVQMAQASLLLIQQQSKPM